MNTVRLTDYSRRVVAGYRFNVFRDEGDKSLYHVFSLSWGGVPAVKLGTILREKVTWNIPIMNNGIELERERSLYDAGSALLAIYKKEEERGKS
jgi:hypothetical protein